MSTPSLPEPPRWMDFAACKGTDTEAFFPAAGPHDPNAQAALALCTDCCPVRKICLKFALSIPVSEDHGIYGGTTARQRRKIREQRAREAA